MPYLTLEQYRLQSDLPGEYVDEVEQRSPGYIAAKIAQASAAIDGRLAKRYETPFRDPPPVAVQQWVIDLISPRVWRKRGVSATDEQMTEFNAAAEQARKELEEAANSETGLFDLPLRGDTAQSGVLNTFPTSYSEQSPYVGGDVTRRIGVQEDRAGEGTHR